tara:strand:- start:3598 stop:4473 length:876 start_codon:yes stop_codon:yes gene_type:complete
LAKKVNLNSNPHYDRVFITGTNGCVGSHLYSILSDDFPVVRLIRNKNNKYHIADSKRNNRSCLIHFSSKTPTNSTSKDFDLNQIHLKSIINQLSSFNNSIDVIFASSMAVYDYELCGIEVSEDSPKTKTNLYGVSKYKCELILKDFQNKGQIKNFISLRLPGILSPKGKPIHNFLLKAIDGIKKNQDINLYKPVASFNNVVTSKNIAQFIRKILKKEVYNNSILNLASWPPCPLEELIEYALKLYDSNSIISWQEKDSGFSVNIDLALNSGYSASNPFEAINEFKEFSESI